jgi:hypothetical protein
MEDRSMKVVGRALYVVAQVSLAVILSFFLALFAVGCACGEPSRRNDPLCVVERAVVDCSTDAVTSVVPEFLPVVLALVASLTGADGHVDWTKVEAPLAHLGVRDGLCLLAELEKALEGAGPKGDLESARRLAEAKDGISGIRAHRWPGLRAKLPSGEVK